MHRSGMLGSAERPTHAAGLEMVPSSALASPKVSHQPRRFRPRAWQVKSVPADSQPGGLYVLGTVECCAGFAFYTLGSLLVLYLTESAGQDQTTALRWVGTFNAACFVAPLFGGFLADRWLGFRRATLYGAGLLVAGFVALALIPALVWPGLALLLLGNGLFRSNIVATLGRLYLAGDSRRDGGYRLLYATFNLGAMLGPPLAGLLAKAHHWPAAFLLGAFAMLLALLALQLGHRKLARADQPTDEARDNPEDPDRPAAEIPRWLAIVVIAQVALLWTVGYGQTDGTLLLWARDDTRRSLLGLDVPASAFVSVPPLLVLILTPLWALAERSAVGSTLTKILLGLGCTSLGFVLMIGAATIGELPTNAFWLLGCLAL